MHKEKVEACRVRLSVCFHIDAGIFEDGKKVFKKIIFTAIWAAFFLYGENKSKIAILVIVNVFFF